MCGLARLFGYLEGACLLNYLMHVLLTHPQGKTHIFKGSEILLHIGRKKKKLDWFRSVRLITQMHGLRV